MTTIDDKAWRVFGSKFQLQTAVRIVEVNLYHFPENGSSEAHVNGICPGGGCGQSLTPCTLYFPFATQEEAAAFKVEDYRPGAYHWVSASYFTLPERMGEELCFLEFTTEPVSANQATFLETFFNSSSSESN